MAKKELAKKAAVVRATTKEDKKTALDGALKQIEKKYGAGAIMRLGQTKTLNVDCIPTGSMTLDMALGIGGVPRGRIVEVYGPESSGKTTVALSIIAQAQKLGGEAAFIDVEHALDPRRILCGDARRVDIRRLCRMSATALNDHKQQHRSVRDKHGTELEYRSDALCGRCGKRCIVRHRAHQSRSTVEYLVELCLSCTDELLQLCKLACRHAVAVH